MYRVRIPLGWAERDEVVRRCVSWMGARLGSTETAGGTLTVGRPCEGGPVLFELCRDAENGREHVRLELDSTDEPDHELYASIHGLLRPAESSQDDRQVRHAGSDGPELAAALVRTFGAFEERDVLTIARVVDREDVTHLVEYLRDRDRRMAVVVMAPRSGWTPLLDADAVAQAIVCHAHPYKLADSRAVEAFSDAVGAHACPEDAVRLFWPGFIDTDPSHQHPLWTWPDVARLEGDFPLELQRTLMDRVEPILDVSEAWQAMDWAAVVGRPDMTLQMIGGGTPPE